uniref:helix-turn-helix domain-containing protein n=1 Tax=Dermacoccus nishinomiyaensis TaxID=1274 RepID=UPI00248EC052
WGLDGMELADAANKAKVLKASDGVGDRSAAIIRLLEKHPEGLGPTEVGRLLDLPQDQAKTYLKRLQDGGRIAKQQRGKYTSVTSVTSVTFAPIAEVIPLSSLAEGNTSNTSNTVTYGGATS